MIALAHPQDEVQEYIDGVLSGEIVVGRLVRLAVERHVKDLAEADARGFYFDPNIATRAIMFFPLVCRHSLGEWEGQPFHLSPWQQFVIWVLFGWRRKGTGFRRFSKAHISVARKNGKTTMIAALALLLIFADEPFEPGAHVYCAATAEKQARLMYDEAVRIVGRSPAMKKKTRIYKAPPSIQFTAKNSFFKPLGSDSKNTDGLNPHGVLMDELHEWRERHRGLMEKLETGSGARRQPMQIAITTAGDDHSEIWKVEDEHCVKVLESVVTGNIIDDNQFVFIARIDEEDDPFDPKAWPKANPNWNISVKPESVEKIANEARHKPTAQSKLIRYHCNKRVGSTERAISLDVWMRGAKPLTIGDGAYGHGGFDIGRSDDWCAIAAVFPVENTDEEGNRTVERWEVLTKAWTVKNGAFRIDREPFRSWIASGKLVAHEGDQVEFSEVVETILEWHNRYSIHTWAYDPNHARLIAEGLYNEHGIQIFKFSQAEHFYNEPCTRFHDEMKAGRIHHGNDPVLEWQAGNLQWHRNSKGLIMPDKKNRESKIDAMVATLMAFSECLFAEKQDNKGPWFITS